MIIKSNDAEMAAVLATAERMCAAARTAPKTCGIDMVLTGILTEDDIEKIAVKMEEMGAEFVDNRFKWQYCQACR